MMTISSVVRFGVAAVTAVIGMSTTIGTASADDALKAQLDSLRQALAKYEDPYVAVRDLYLSTVGCVHYDGSKREGHMDYPKGAMGIHFVNLTVQGPPDPMKPASELYGEMLLEANRPDEAAAAFSQALLRTPKRTPSLLGLARATVKAGRTSAARQHYAAIAGMPGAAPTSPAVMEAQKFLKTAATEMGRQ